MNRLYVLHTISSILAEFALAQEHARRHRKTSGYGEIYGSA